MSHPIERILILGCGYSGRAVGKLARARGLKVLAHTRDDGRALDLQQDGFDVLQRATLDEDIAAHVDSRTHVIIAFPPDGSTDARVAPALRTAAAISYVSSTGVYDDVRGHIDDETPLPSTPSPRAARILNAEQAYRAVGGCVLRCPGIYGPDRGLHMRILRGEHKLPGDGSRTLSRIHVEDLAQLLLASSQTPGETFVVGDQEPAPHVEVVRFVCSEYGAAMPESVPLGSVHDSLRADRQIDASRALSRLGIQLKYPSYREGMAASATRLSLDT